MEGGTVFGVPLGGPAGAVTGAEDSSGCSLLNIKDEKSGKEVSGDDKLLKEIHSGLFKADKPPN